MPLGRQIDHRAREREQQEPDRDGGQRPRAADERPRQDRGQREERQLEIAVDRREAARVEGRVRREPGVGAVVEDAADGARIDAVVRRATATGPSRARSRRRSPPAARPARPAAAGRSTTPARAPSRARRAGRDPREGERRALHPGPVGAAVEDHRHGDDRAARPAVRHWPPPAGASAPRAPGPTSSPSRIRAIGTPDRVRRSAAALWAVSAPFPAKSGASTHTTRDVALRRAQPEQPLGELPRTWRR